jgi:hypothetical protein
MNKDKANNNIIIIIIACAGCVIGIFAVGPARQ